MRYPNSVSCTRPLIILHRNIDNFASIGMKSGQRNKFMRYTQSKLKHKRGNTCTLQTEFKKQGNVGMQLNICTKTKIFVSKDF